MKKTIRLFVITMMVVMLGMTNLAEARKGQTSSETQTSESKSGSYSKPSKTSKRSQSTAFGNAAKTKQAKTAWQDYLKKHEKPKPDFSKPEPISPRQNDSQDLQEQLADLQTKIKSEKKRKKADKLAKQLAAIEQQIADAKRQQQLIAIAQTAAQALLNKQRQPSVSVVQTPSPGTALPATAVNQTGTTPAKPAASSDGSWGLIFLIIAGVVIVILWRRSSHTPTTNYRL